MQEIKDYLNGNYQSWERGRELFLKHGKDLTLKQALKRGVFSDPLYLQLIEALKNLIQSSKKGFRVWDKEEFLKQFNESDSEILSDVREDPPEEAPEARDRIGELEKQNIYLYNQRGILSNKLVSTRSNKGAINDNRLVILEIEKIVGNMAANRKKINRIRAGEEIGKPIDERKILIYTKDQNFTFEDLTELSYVELGALRESVRNRINRAKGKLKNSKEPADIELLTKEIAAQKEALGIVDDLRQRVKNG